MEDVEFAKELSASRIQSHHPRKSDQTSSQQLFGSQEVFDVSEDDPDALPSASFLGDYARAYPNARLLYREDDPFQNTGPGEVRQGAKREVASRWSQL
eukprot:Skav229869  [mRNA]  locus=scaffold247:114002:114295:+ [translate_table: standard]